MKYYVVKCSFAEGYLQLRMRSDWKRLLILISWIWWFASPFLGFCDLTQVTILSKNPARESVIYHLSRIHPSFNTLLFGEVTRALASWGRCNLILSWVNGEFTADSGIGGQERTFGHKDNWKRTVSRVSKVFNWQIVFWLKSVPDSYMT
jgi:hypothetical protein